MTATDAAAGVGEVGQVRAALRRTQRRQQMRAGLLIAPLCLFLLVVFAYPIADMLARSIHDTDATEAFPRTTALIENWDGQGLPAAVTIATFADELRAARGNRKLAGAARRLNFDTPGMRTLIFATARRLPDEFEVSAAAALTEIDPAWAKTDTWAAVKRATRAYTDFYMLAAVDLIRDADNDIVRRPANQAIFLDILGRSVRISLIVTAACFLLGYPVAHLLAHLPRKWSNAVLILVLIPFWTSLLVRTSAWIVMLQDNGLVNDVLRWVGLVGGPLEMIYNRTGVYVAMTHILLPFMILPVYSVMKGIPPDYFRAALSLGGTPFRAFRKVYFPLTVPGVAAGALLVFVIGLGYYITPALVGGAEDQMISYYIAFYTNRTINWSMAAALSAILLVSTLLLFAVFNRLAGFDRLRLG